MLSTRPLRSVDCHGGPHDEKMQQTTPAKNTDSSVKHVDTSKSRWRVLMVGDGDFSGSLALMRAYPQHLAKLVATTVLSTPKELQATYPETAKSNIGQLLDANQDVPVEILYSVDATRLHLDERLLMNTFDLICFQFPHVGYSHSKSVEEITQENSNLVQTYLESAHDLLRKCQKSSLQEQHQRNNSVRPLVHVALAQTCINNWNLTHIIQTLEQSKQMTLHSIHPISKPMLDHFFFDDDNSKAAASEKSFDDRSSSSQSKEEDCCQGLQLLQKARRSTGRRGHWLGRFGYRHLPTNPDFDRTQILQQQDQDENNAGFGGGMIASFESKANVSNSHHYFFQLM